MQPYTKYLTEYADSRALPYLNRFSASSNYGACVVVPAFNESEFIFPLIESLDKAASSAELKALVLIVLNHKITTNEHNKAANRALLSKLNSSSFKNVRLEVLDFVSSGTEFGEKEGVGHARKIGSDLALHLYARGMITCPYFHTTDGDALVPNNYFEVTWSNETAAQVCEYTHLPSGDKNLDKAHELYEYSLRYYEKNLADAGSPYAFPTIGSLLTISFDHYAMVRGFPKRLAAEDFYILNKLAKVGKVQKRPAVVSLRARPSDRVPFGTGVGVADILEAHLENFRVYDPRIFAALKTTLSEMNRFPRHRDVTLSRKALSAVPLPEVLTKIGFWRILETAANTRPSETDCLRNLHTAFDAFKTLKFVHEMRNCAYPMVEPKRE